MKDGLDYFPLSVTNADAIELIEAEFGTEGFSVTIKLLQKIYGGFGYYCNWSEDIEMVFAKKVGIPFETVSEIVTALLCRRLFDIDMYEKYSILTSLEIQKNFFEAVKRRKELKFKKEYLLFTPKMKNVNISEENVYNSPENVNISEQSRVEESKVKESKAEDSKVCESETPTRTKKPYGEYNNVFLSDGERDKLSERYGMELSKVIDNLSEYMESTGKSYRSHYATLNRWARQDIRGAPEKGEFDDLEMLTRKRIENEDS